ncbi:NAD(P)-binding protein [Xylaria bambusicola]|uniref:NAD(P)-binding protein n=1 Tax=Xylaria bambusicola TaxID=326684 RepID=UPI00200770C8|nr:NAD(P)-binding protein [Xylaria bambusicola]KAI0508811.1 NAD(P)-binding protein [Xylaria bambusicola]
MANVHSSFEDATSHTFRPIVNGTLKHILFSLFILSLIYYVPETLEANPVSKFLSPPWLVSVKLILCLFLGLNSLRALNNALNAWSTNNWRITANQDWAWDREVAVVTGGSGDIGQALVEGLISKGVQVAVLDVHELPSRLKDNKNVIFVKCDVSSPTEITAAQKLIERTFGPPSILINNAGIVRTTTILDEPEDHLRRIVGVNLMAHWFTAKVFLPHMLSQNKGHVITMASLAAYVALPTSVDYSATKAGALAFHEGLTCEIKHLYKAPGVMTTIVLPDFVKTNMTKAYWAEVEAAGGLLLGVDQVVDPILKQIFSRRGGQIFVPKSRAVVSSLRGWPNWLQEVVRDVIGRKDRVVDSPLVRKK